MKVALAGNPNSGKTSLFNLLTGAQQKVGNYPGVTVARRAGRFVLDSKEIDLLDLPGIYSLFPNSEDERVSTEVLLQRQHPDFPDLVIYVADANQLDRQLLLLSQIRDLDIPIVLVLSLFDAFEKAGHQVDQKRLGEALGVPVLAVNSKKKESRESVIRFLTENLSELVVDREPLYDLPQEYSTLIQEAKDGLVDKGYSDYHLLQRIHQVEWLDEPQEEKVFIASLIAKHEFHPLKAQINETLTRFQYLEPLAAKVFKRNPATLSVSQKADAVLTHSVWGPIIFIILMLLVFQAIFAWAGIPMDAIEYIFAAVGSGLVEVMPGGWFTDMIVEGLLPGLSGVLIFVPQIAILFFLISLLEESGYMARAVYLFDHALQGFGMNGRSIVALISGGACAIPAIMTARTISNWKERLITILVTPFISCAARIPVYTLLIAFVVPYQNVGGIFNTQGLAFAGLYVLSVITALLSGWVFKKMLSSSTPSMLAMEMPVYRWPDGLTVWRTIKTKVGSFITEAGKIILVIAMALWFLASYGPSQAMDQAAASVTTLIEQGEISEDEAGGLLASRELEASYAGHLGKFIEPVMRPLGFDWKMSIAVITSFAAREVFVGTLATIYSVGEDENEFRIREHLANQRDPETGEPVFNRAVAMSLLMFFVFAMQCMSTLAIVKEETKSWKWPIVQFVLMTGLAYLVSFIVYQTLS